MILHRDNNPSFACRFASGDTHLLKGILKLQSENHKDSVRDKTQGFVTLKHDLELLQDMDEHIGQAVAVVEGDPIMSSASRANTHNGSNMKNKPTTVVGYVLMITVSMRDRIPLLNSLVIRLEKENLVTPGTFCVGGQVCVEHDFRGTGVLSALYNHHRQKLSQKYSSLITAVSSSNPRSLRAHEKVGFRILATFEDEEDTWHAIIWEWKTNENEKGQCRRSD